ncbi:hypothetical protein CC80DRAFT_399090 [Byssothecium circinans]|uniref:Uncharacterized protein n=1 Tax=Byssothecium circinans TaxID=147558 RepID=A0A6A5UP26_9PLEO|nr:hypothetical protein CC80DRAFT_399090 [Byssothecium circinans]
MEHRHSSPASPSDSLRPSTHRKRSNSVPIVEALGCSTPEAELILAEGRAAVRRRKGSAGRGRRREFQHVYQPKDHLKFLNADAPRRIREDSMSIGDRKSLRHSRFPSDVTDSSIITVVAAGEPSTTSPKNPLGNYSANLAKFIQAQLSSIPSYSTTQLAISPCSCPDFSYAPRSPQLSPTASIRRPVDAPHTITIPPVRPPMKSAFSEWSSTDDDTDDERGAMTSSGTPAKAYTPSELRYYENTNDSSFLFSSTPLDREENDLDTAKGFSFPNQAELPGSSADIPSPSHEAGNSPLLSSRPPLTSSSAPSFSSVSTGEYFDFKFNPQMRAQIIAAVTPPSSKGIPSVSPFNRTSLSNVHDALVDSHNRVFIDGLSFDMQRDFTMPEEGMRRVQTPC